MKKRRKNRTYIDHESQNTGDGIGYCLYYIELTNLLTGKQNKLKVKQFGILPKYEKNWALNYLKN